jgi:hypothetical protein
MHLKSIYTAPLTAKDNCFRIGYLVGGGVDGNSECDRKSEVFPSGLGDLSEAIREGLVDAPLVFPTLKRDDGFRASQPLNT